MQDNQLKNVNREEAEEIKEHGAVQDDYQPDIGTMRVDLHCHSETSWDCITSLEDIPAQCLQKGIQVQAITDHNEIWGAQTIKAQVESDPHCDLTIIVGEEISTSEGEIIGLFLQSQIEPGLTPEETVRQIRAQNGLVLLPHGFDPLKRFRLQPKALSRVADELDIIETFNARISRPHWNQAAVAWAQDHGILMSAGSDAHRLTDIGAAWVEVPRRPIRTPDDLLAALQDGVPTGEWTHPVWAFVLKMWEQAKNRLGLPVW